MIIELYLFHPELTSMEINNATAIQFLFLGHILFYLLINRGPRDSQVKSPLEFCGVVISNFFSLISHITVIFFNCFSLETSLFYLLLFSFIIIVL